MTGSLTLNKCFKCTPFALVEHGVSHTFKYTPRWGRMVSKAFMTSAWSISSPGMSPALTKCFGIQWVDRQVVFSFFLDNIIQLSNKLNFVIMILLVIEWRICGQDMCLSPVLEWGTCLVVCKSGFKTPRIFNSVGILKMCVCICVYVCMNICMCANADPFCTFGLWTTLYCG